MKLELRIEAVCRAFGFVCPIICTPAELLDTWAMREIPIIAEIRSHREAVSRECDYDAATLMAYYRQREWRILGSMELEGVAATRPQSSTERARLLALDEEFFTRPITLRDGTTPQTVDECVLLSEVDGKHVVHIHLKTPSAVFLPNVVFYPCSLMAPNSVDQ